jgi:putative endopeptidase
MDLRGVVTVAIALAALGAGAASSQPSASTPGDGEAPLSALPYAPSLDPAAMDRAVDPCVDLYRYACGGWMARNPIPPGEERWNVYQKLAHENQRFLWGILVDVAHESAHRSDVQRKLGDYFAACMDEAAIERLGAAPLAPHLERIAAMRSKDELPAVLAGLQAIAGDDGFSFGFRSGQDFADSTRVIAFATAGGIGMPDRDYYVNDDERTRDIRARYRAHVARTFELLGDSPATAATEADTVLALETALAQATLTRVERRDPYRLFHRYDLAKLQALTPRFDWSRYVQAAGITPPALFNVTQPAFYEAFNRQLASLDLDAVRTYLRWHLARALSPHLSASFVTEDFDFYQKTLRGAQSLRPRWKRCVTLIDEQMGEALGQEFVRRAFPPALKGRTLRMTRQIEQAMAADIRALPWMTPATKAEALQKLHAMVNKIGYPDKWRDYTRLDVRRDDYAGNVARGNAFELRRQLAKIDKPLDRGEWRMTPATVNAYYDAQLNAINFPAGILQPPLYDPAMDDAPNYGNTGGTIGHELTHGFDDAGRKFDARGNLRDWWGRADAAAFTERSQCIVDQFAQYTIVDDIKINSRLTLGEDIADLGGLVLAWAAWQKQIAGSALAEREGLTPAQRFFVGNAQWACENDRPENQRVRAIVDPHSPARYRVNGLVANMPEFAAAFGCKAGQPLVRENRCRVW